MKQLLTQKFRTGVNRVHLYLSNFEKIYHDEKWRGPRAKLLLLSLFISLFTFFGFVDIVSRIAISFTLTNACFAIIILTVYNVVIFNTKEKDEETGISVNTQPETKTVRRKQVINKRESDTEEVEEKKNDEEGGIKIHRSHTERAEEMIKITDAFKRASENANRLELERKKQKETPLVVLSKHPPSQPLNLNSILHYSDSESLP